MNYDVIIIGAGPGGIFSAFELAKLNPKLKVAVFESGHSLEKRLCPIDGEKIKIIDFYQDTGSTSITLDYTDKGDVGPITLVFSNNPMELKQWKIVDPQSVEVSVSLYDAKKDHEIDDEVFKFKNKKTSSRNFKKKK